MNKLKLELTRKNDLNKPAKLTFKNRETPAIKPIESVYSVFLEENIIVPHNERKFLGSVFQMKNGKWRVKIEVSDKSRIIPYSLSIFKGGLENKQSAEEFRRKMCIQHGLIRNLMIDRGDYIEMTLTDRGITKIDKDDFFKVDDHLWFGTVTNGLMYARRVADEEENKDDEGRHRYALHNEIMNFLPNKDGTGDSIDHINRDSLDNRKSNLRIASKLEQADNRNDTSYGKSGHKNILIGDKNGSKYYEVRVMAKGKRKRAYYFWSEHGGVQTALEKALNVRDKAKRLIKDDPIIAKKLYDNKITLSEL